MYKHLFRDYKFFSSKKYISVAQYTNRNIYLGYIMLFSFFHSICIVCVVSYFQMLKLQTSLKLFCEKVILK